MSWKDKLGLDSIAQISIPSKKLYELPLEEFYKAKEKLHDNHAAMKDLQEFYDTVLKYPLGTELEVSHDGFIGTVQGYYKTREGKYGVVLQSKGTKVIHVYQTKWFKNSEDSDKDKDKNE